ncbi:MAG: hypothetical protein O7D32_08890 [bacterium]|nr:hypothetical protein [bacterium]
MAELLEQAVAVERQMIRTFLFSVVFSAALLPAVAWGQVYYTYPSADVLDDRAVTAGPYFAGGNRLLGTALFARLGVSKYLEAGLETQVDYDHSEWLWGMGVDAKLGLFPAEARFPFDMSFNTGLGFRIGDTTDSFQIPIGLLMSSPYKTDGGNSLTPYGGVYLLITDTRVDTPTGKASDRNLDVELRLGLRYTTVNRLDLWGAIHLGREALFQIGFIFRVR